MKSVGRPPNYTRVNLGKGSFMDLIAVSQADITSMQQALAA